MRLEGFSKRGMELGNDPERINETKNNLRQQYINAIKRLALEKMQNNILFEIKLEATMRNLSSLGLEVSRESMLKDIETEINKQRMEYDIDFDRETSNLVAESQSEIQQPTNIDNEIEQLKQNLGRIFDSVPAQEQKPINTPGTIPREPAIESAQQYEIPTNIDNEIEQLKQNLGRIFDSVPAQEQKPINTPGTIPREPAIESAQQYEIPTNNLSQESESAVQQTHTQQENQQPNEPTMTYTGNLTNLSDNIKKRIIQQMEARGEVIISGIDNIYQEGKYIVVDAKDNQGRFIGAEFTLDDFSKLVNQQETEQSLQEQQKQMKDKMVNQIMGAMNNAGEFSFGDISMDERKSIMQNVRNKLNNKSMDELQILLSTYQEQNVQEEIIHTGMHR